MSAIGVVGKAGGTEFKWNPDTAEGVELAELLFDEKTRRFGHLAFLEGPHGEGSEVMRNFDYSGPTTGRRLK